MAQKQFKIGLSNTDKQNMAQDVYERLLALTFPEYETTESYEIGDFVVYNDQLYKCIGATSGAWDNTKWQLATLNDLLTDIENAVAFVNDKANVDGNYPTMTVGLANNFTPYDESAGDDQDTPFSLQATGTGNGSQSDFSTGEYALLKEKQGNAVAVNNRIKNGNFTNGTDYWTSQNGSINVSNGVLNFTASAYRGNVSQNEGLLPTTPNHKVLIICSIKCSVSNGARLYAYGGYITRYVTIANAFQTIAFILTTDSSWGIDLTNNNVIRFEDMRQSDWDAIQIKDVFCVDLTQWFNGDIPQDLLDNPDHFFRYYQGSLAYNEGTLVNANGRYIKCIGMNQFDGTNDVKAIPNAIYYIYGSATLTYKDKDGNTIDSESKSNETFVAPSNCLSIGVSGSGDISINLYYEDEPRCLTYEPYQVLTNNDTGIEVLRSAGSVKDSKAPDGTITRRIGVVDLGDLTWGYISGYFYSNDISSLAKASGKLTCSKYKQASSWQEDKTIQLLSNSQVCVFDSAYTDAVAFKNDMSGVYLFYELAEPTTEQGTPFSENLVIDDFGSMDFDSDVPQGALIFYPVDYKAFVDTLYKYTDGTPSNIALKSDLAVVNEKIGAKLPECPTTTDGTYVLKATVSNGSVVYSWVLEE